MSRTQHERSVPQMRGRQQEACAKRLAHKRMRRLALSASTQSLKIAGKSVMMDRETRQADVG
jgi:hypothetical protein